LVRAALGVPRSRVPRQAGGGYLEFPQARAQKRSRARACSGDSMREPLNLGHRLAASFCERGQSPCKDFDRARTSSRANYSDSLPNQEKRRSKAWPGECLAAGVCTLIGVSLAVLPHLLWWPELGTPVWIADNDDLLYLSYAGQAYDNHPAKLGDPILVTGGTGMYPWLQLGPGVLLGKAFGLGPMAVSLIWRAWAGLSIALAWYLVIRAYVSGPFWAAVVVAGLLADIGLLTGHLLVKQFVVLYHLLSGQYPELLAGKPD